MLLVEGAAGPLYKVEDTTVWTVDLGPLGLDGGVISPGTCFDNHLPEECERTEPYGTWEAGAGYLDVPGALRALDELE